MSSSSHNRPRRNTIEDVASAAGVSLATVSRALRGLPNVATSTRERIERVATRLDYRPDPIAARLATGHTDTVALVLPVLDTWYFSRLMAGVEQVCRASGYDAIVMAASASTDPSGRMATGIARSLLGRADAVVLVDLQLAEAERDRLIDSGLAVVTIGDSDERFPAVGIDNVAAGRMATEHLLELGHRRIGLVGGKRHDPLGIEVPDGRRRGYADALSASGVEVDAALMVEGPFSVSGGQIASVPLFELDDPPTAIVAMSDEIAFGVMMAARARGLEIPEDLSIVGIDDHDVAQVLELTTVRQDVPAQGSEAARVLLAALEGRQHHPSPASARLTLCVRRSTRRR